MGKELHILSAVMSSCLSNTGLIVMLQDWTSTLSSHGNRVACFWMAWHHPSWTIGLISHTHIFLRECQ